jgi:hypothetical protein
MRRSERRKRGSFDFVKEGKLQKQAQIGRLRVRSALSESHHHVFVYLWMHQVTWDPLRSWTALACCRTLRHQPGA